MPFQFRYPMHLPVLFASLLLLSTAACRPHGEVPTLVNPTQQAGIASVYYALLSSYCYRSEIALHEQLPGRQSAPKDTIRCGQGHAFISRSGPRYSQKSVRFFLRKHHLDDSVDWPRLFTPQVPASVPPFAVGLCQNRLRAVVYTDPAQRQLNNLLTVSEPVALRSGQQLVYYEMGNEPTKMMAGVLLLLVEPTGNRRLVAESMLWIN